MRAAMGQKRTSSRKGCTSAFPPKGDMTARLADVRFATATLILRNDGLRQASFVSIYHGLPPQQRRKRCEKSYRAIGDLKRVPWNSGKLTGAICCTPSTR